MRLWPAGAIPTQKFNRIPENYAHEGFVVKGAAADYTEWNAHSILVQSVQLSKSRLCIIVIAVEEEQVILASPDEGTTVIGYLLAGSVTSYSQGLGKHDTEQGTCVLAWYAAASENYLHVNKGLTVIISVEFAPEQLLLTGQVAPAQLDYFVQHAKSGHPQCLMQLYITPDDRLKNTLHSFLRLDYTLVITFLVAEGLCSRVQKRYVQLLVQTMRSKKMHSGLIFLAIRIKEYLDENYSLPFNMHTLRGHFNASDYSLKNAFKSLTNQSINAYAKEKRFCKARDILEEDRRGVKSFARELGISYCTIVTGCKQRFQKTTTEIKNAVIK